MKRSQCAIFGLLLGALGFSCTHDPGEPLPQAGGGEDGEASTGGSEQAADESGGQDETAGPPPPLDRGGAEEQCAALGQGIHLGETRLRRMTRSALDNTLADLLGTTGHPSAAIELDESIGPFYSNAIAPVTDLIVQQYSELAAQVAHEALARRDTIAGCDLDLHEDCRDTFIRDFGLRAYRRPLDADELELYRGLYDVGHGEGGTDRGFSLVVEVMLQSPFFLYHVDLGPDSLATTAASPLTSYELASRLSYFLWNRMPDDELLAAARDDALRDQPSIEAQVDRMLADPRAAQAIASFHLQWLDIHDMQSVIKSADAHPEFDAALRDAMLTETTSFVDRVVREGDGTMKALLSADYSYLEGPLFDLYGVPRPPVLEPDEPVALDPAQRAGLLTQAAFLATHAHPDQSSPVHRGLIVRENLLCQTVPSPPPDVDTVAPAVEPGTSTRDRFAQHTAEPSCAACHLLIDPIGLGFEHYDPVGAWRTEDNGIPVDASGELRSAGDDIEGPFDGGVELAHRLADSQQVGDCLTRQWFRFALGRMEAADDACTLASLYADFDASDRNIRSLLRAIATSTSFTHVRAGEQP